ncbi:MAG: M16 family metallopeptidase, partial [Bacillota bacterium]
KEKQLMIEQLNATEDQPAAAAFQDYLQLFYGNHPIGLPANAIADRVKNFTRDDLLAWYQKVYIPDNMVISVVGKVDPGVIESLFRETLGKMPARERPEAVIAETPSKSRNQQIVKLRESQALFMVLGFPAPRITDGDYPVMEVINYILGGDMGSRLFMELREKKGLAYDVSTGYNTGDYPGTVFAFMATEPSNYQEARDGLIKEFQRLMVETVPERELTAAKQAVKGAFLMSHETNAGQNRLLARYEILGLGYQQDQRYPGLVKKVTAKDIQIVAKRYFSHYILSMVSPVDIPSLKASKASFEEGKEFYQD